MANSENRSETNKMDSYHAITIECNGDGSISVDCFKNSYFSPMKSFNFSTGISSDNLDTAIQFIKDHWERMQ